MAAGARRVLGVPALVISASFTGFGALVAEHQFGLLPGVLSSLTIFAMPGQVVLVELYGAGASLLAIALAVALTNARLLPMTVALAPILKAKGRAGWRLYVAAHWIAVTAWVAGMQHCPKLPREQRLAYFMGMALVLWLATLLATALGFWLAGVVPRAVSLGLVFINPIYFMLALLGDLHSRARAVALVAGAVLGPTLHLLTSDWGLLLAGIAAGTLGFALRARGRGHG